jgi:hypothetical protein
MAIAIKKFEARATGFYTEETPLVTMQHVALMLAY